MDLDLLQMISSLSKEHQSNIRSIVHFWVELDHYIHDRHSMNNYYVHL